MWNIVQLLNHVQLFVTPWTAAWQASLSFTISWTLFKFISIELVMPSNYLILCQPKGNEGGKYGYLSEVSVVPKLRNLINIAYVFKTIFLTFFFYWNLLRSFLFSLMFLPWILSSINITFLASLFISLILSFSQKCLS